MTTTPGASTARWFSIFGGQNSDNTGTLLTGLQTYVSYGTIASLADNFALGYYNGTGSDHTSVLKLAIGTNNSAYHIDTAGGNAWAGVVVNVSNWVDNVAHIGGQVFVGGANDMETIFDTYTPTKSWVDAFSAAGPSYYLNYGDPTNCSPNTHTNASCGTTGWNQDDVWYVSWGATIAFATPQIYYQNQANQWGQINLWKSMGFEGPLDEHDLNGSTFDSLPAWNALWGTTLGDLPFSLQIHLLT